MQFYAKTINCVDKGTFIALSTHTLDLTELSLYFYDITDRFFFCYMVMWVGLYPVSLHGKVTFLSLRAASILSSEKQTLYFHSVAWPVHCAHANSSNPPNGCMKDTSLLFQLKMKEQRRRVARLFPRVSAASEWWIQNADPCHRVPGLGHKATFEIVFLQERWLRLDQLVCRR